MSEVMNVGVMNVGQSTGEIGDYTTVEDTNDYYGQ